MVKMSSFSPRACLCSWPSLARPLEYSSVRWPHYAGLDETASGMDALKNKMKALMPKKEPKQKMAIVILSIILVVLLFLVAYT